MNRNVYHNRVIELIPIIAILVALALYFYNSIFYYVGAGRDDTFITLWAGTSLAEGRGLVNYNFEPVEMASSLLHTFIVAFIHLLVPNYIYTINKALGLTAGTILLVVLYQKRGDLFGRDLPGIIAFAITTLGLANYRAWLYWNLGGLETPFQTLILFLYGLYLVEFWKTSIGILKLVALQILYILVRPEGFLLLFFTAALIFTRAKFRQPLDRKQTIILLGIPSFAFALILITRYLNFGLLLPTPVYAKISLGADNSVTSGLNTGIEYLRGFYTSSPYAALQPAILVAVAIYAVHLAINKRTNLDSGISIWVPNFVVWLGLILFNHLFVVGTGGDWMEFFRFIVPIIPFSVILTTCFSFRMMKEVLEKLIGPKPVVETFPNVALGVLFLFMIATNSSQRDNYGTQDFHNCSEKMDRSIIRSLVLDHGQLDIQLLLLNCAGKRDWDGAMPFIMVELPKLYESLNQNITVATYQMGFFPYYVKKINPGMNIEFIDTLGLADNNIARLPGSRKRYGLSEGNRIVDIFAGRAGELSEYVLSRHPNMIYVLNATSIRKMAMTDLGWTTSWDKPGAVIFVKNDQ